uniref:Laminin subunit alpha 4 n=1 Tax=Esox lucius TaxID=8010 RepID=A0A6Q2ZNV8_ESOLU
PNDYPPCTIFISLSSKSLGTSLTCSMFEEKHLKYLKTIGNICLNIPTVCVKVCDKGYFLSNQNQCLPCNCKGHSETCEDITGICISCQDHTTGDFCEICQDGYMPEVSTFGRHSCRPCACPLSIPSNNQRITGNLPPCSTRCAPGFYGNPMVIGDSCKRCDCNGNSDPNHIFNECHNVTGFCQNCWGNTAGANCERCAPGFYGDAISAKNCRGACQENFISILAPPTSGCDECIWHLIGDLRLSNKTLDQVKVSVLNISTGAAANDRLKYYNYTALRLQVQILPLFLSLCERLSLFAIFYYTDGRLAPVREVLSRFTSKLSEARDILQKAANTVQETEDMNKANQVKFQRSEVTSHGPGSIWFRKSHLEPLSSCPPQMPLVDWLTPDSLYHAAIDGADKLLQEKTEALSLADRDLVQRAQDHAKNLQEQADQLENDLKRSDANGFVQKALDAANVYNNIVKYIQEANITGVTTLDLSTRAEDAIDGIDSQLAFVKTESDKILKQSVSELCLQLAKQVHYTDTRFYLTSILNEIIDEALISQTRKYYLKYKVVEILLFTTVVFFSICGGGLVDNLSELVPELLDKLRVVEEKKPVNNVTTNIVRIRQLIAQARSVAKKVQVSMKFNGQSLVEVHPHTNLEDLKTVTSISLFIRVDPDKDPIEDRFIFYLGGRKDYMGLAIKNDNLVYVYNLGKEDVEIALGSKPVSQWPPVFNLVKVERLGRHGKVFLTVPSQTSTVEQKFIQKGEAFGIDSLFDLDPDDTVFFVGGVPADVRLPPALSLAPFVGCIELASLNNDVISLYSFKQTQKMDVVASTPCPRYKLAFSQSRVASYLFDGTGYALIKDIERRGKFGIVTRFDIAVRTVANNGILLLMDNFFLLELKNGFLHLMYNFGFSKGPIIMESDSPKLKINDARYHEVSVIYHYSKKIILLVDKSHVKSVENEKKTLPFSDIYIGGAPSHVLLTMPELFSLVGLKGCVKGFQFQKKDFNLLEEPGTIGISSGCPEESFMSRKAYFNGESYLGSTAKISPFDAFEGGLNFRTMQPTGLLFYYREESEEFTIALENGAVVLNSRGTRVRSQKKQYNDGMNHFLVASVNNNKYELVVDDKDKHEKKRPSSASQATIARNFYIGGSPSSSIKNFTGCISHVYISRQDRDIEPEDFQKFTENVQTSLQDCPVERPPAALLSKHSRNSAKPNQGYTRKVKNLRSFENMSVWLRNARLPFPETPCHLSPQPRATRNAHHYGGTANSRLEFTDIPGSFSERSHFSLSLKTQSSFGLVFYASDEADNDYMALFLAHGKLVYTFNFGQQRFKVKSQEKYNDGAWHNVVMIRDRNLGRLVIDGLIVLEERSLGPNVTWQFSSPLYVGGVPPGRAQRNIQPNSAYSFTGCVKNLLLNGEWLSSVSQTFGVTPCFEGLSEPGTFFTEEGGYVVLDDTFNLGLKFELVMEVRPRVASGVLLHVYTAAEEYLSIVVLCSQVVVLVNNGVREFFTQVTPRLGLCDGNWHRITVIRDANVVQLDVDSEVNHVVGPLNPGAQSVRTPVFIGGAPESLFPEGIATRRAYTGCMRNLTVNESQVSFSKAALVSGAISVGSCPAV